VTHVLLSVNLLVRRRDEIGVIGAALRLADEGVSCEAIARSLGRSAGLVRGWVRRLAGRAEQVRAVFTVLQVALDPDPPPIEPASCRVADAVGREVSTTIYTASSLNSGENFLRFVATVSLSGLPNLSWAAVRKVRGTSSYGAAHELDGLGLVGVGELLAGSTHRVFLLVTAMLMRPLSTRARGV
jgi:hypothetical protein